MVAHALRKRLRKAMGSLGRSAGHRRGNIFDVMGCTRADAVRHLESKFLPGMSWANRREWHIDHIRPLASFDLLDPEQYRQACALSNLQPLWARDNIAKGAKILA